MIVKFLQQMMRVSRDPRAELAPLWRTTVAEARAVRWYAQCGVADTLAGRFDMVTLVLAQILLRMEHEPMLKIPSALLTEWFVEEMDGQLREQGVGDVVVGKHVGRLMATLGGRIGALRDAGGDPALLEGAVLRNVTLGENGSAACVVAGLTALARRLARTDAAGLLQGRIAL